jgi:hypothetical protein
MINASKISLKYQFYRLINKPSLLEKAGFVVSKRESLGSSVSWAKLLRTEHRLTLSREQGIANFYVKVGAAPPLSEASKTI